MRYVALRRAVSLICKLVGFSLVKLFAAPYKQFTSGKTCSSQAESDDLVIAVASLLELESGSSPIPAIFYPVNLSTGNHFCIFPHFFVTGAPLGRQGRVGRQPARLNLTPESTCSYVHELPISYDHQTH